MSGASKDHVKFGRRVRARRKKLGLLVKDLADKAGLSASYLSEVERGRRDVSLETIEKLCAALGMKPGEMFGPALKLSEAGLECARLFDTADPETAAAILQILRSIPRRQG